jgi:ABC-type transport system substrate-binding protein
MKNRGVLVSVFGMFNMLKMGSPRRDIRLRRAAHLAINREDLIQYASKGNGVIVPALLGGKDFGYNPDLAPYAFLSRLERLSEHAVSPP